MIKKYSDLIKLTTFKDRYLYLKLDGQVGVETFGHDRYLNQMLYNSSEWKACRSKIIVRDNGYDLGLEHPDYEIRGRIIIHHINPITPHDIINRTSLVFDPENLITTVDNTHKALHFGDEGLLFLGLTERESGDTVLW